MNKLSTTLNNLWMTRPNHAKVIHNIALTLTVWVRWVRLKRAAEAGSSRKLSQLTPQLCLLLSLLTITTTTQAIAYDPNTELYKLYAHMKLGNDKQYRCLVTLWRLESQWSPTANNPKSSAFGIPQLLKLKETNPYKQIDLGLKYINYHKLYKGDVCKALDRHKKVGHY
jgi:hypothetical protein